MTDAVKIAQKVIDLNEEDDYEGILNLAAPSVEARIRKDSPHNMMRKLYLKLSLIIHPDKLGKKFTNATKAFQALVKAFESLTAPEIEDEDSQKSTKKRSGKDKAATIFRSNENCYRTRVCCPRCQQPWNEGSLDGNPDYVYNFLMMGLKQYLCSTCLCEFGCMTAVHKCPHCKRQFEYTPSDYHRQITCGNPGCEKKFGFMMFPASDRVMKELRASVKQEQEQRLKTREAKQRRAARSNRGGVLTVAEQESSFLMGLSDTCPRCGEDFTAIEDEEEQRRHLMNCTDDSAHKQFAAKKEQEAAKKSKKDKLLSEQEAAQTHAAWQFLGANDAQLWLLEDAQLRLQADARGLDTSGDKEQLIARLVRSSRDTETESPPGGSTSGRRSSTQLKLADAAEHEKQGSSSSSSLQAVTTSRKRGRGGGSTTLAESLPSNLHSMSLAQLRAVCAAHDLQHLLRRDMTKAELLDALEDEVYEQPAAPAATKSASSNSKGKRKTQSLIAN